MLKRQAMGLALRCTPDGFTSGNRRAMRRVKSVGEKGLAR